MKAYPMPAQRLAIRTSARLPETKDLNADGIINSEDRRVIGNTLPKHQGGFGFDARWKGFDASIFFNWSYGNDVYNTGKIQYNQFRRITYGNLLTTMSSDNRFTYVDVDGSYTGTPGEVITDSPTGAIERRQNIWSHNSFGVAQYHPLLGGRGRLLPAAQQPEHRVLAAGKPHFKIGLSQLRIYATGYNLKLWTNYSGYDPEVSTTRSSSYAVLTPGVDYSSFPRSRAYTFGINVTFNLNLS